MDARRLILYVVFLVVFFCLVLGLYGEWDWFHEGSAPGSLSAANNSVDEPKQSDAQENTGPGKEEPVQTENKIDDIETVDDVSGVYRVNVRTNKGARYSTNVTIKDLGSNIQINANYKGMKIPVTGMQRGSRTKSSGSWSFSVYVPLLFNGSGMATIKSTKSGLVITGQGSGEYFSFEGNGNGSATGSGSRISSTKGTTSGKVYLQGIEKATSFAAPDRSSPIPSPINTGAAAAASAIGLAASAAVSARNRVQKRKSLRNSALNDTTTSGRKDVNSISSKTDNPANNSSSDTESETEQGGE